MAFRHGKDTVVSLNAVDYSVYSNTTSFGDETDTHDVTCYGAGRKAYSPGLGDGTITVGGIYNDTAVSGPRALFKPLKNAGTESQFIFRPEGTGSGKRQSKVNVLVKTFNESAPVGEMIAWTSELQMTGALDETAQ